MATDWEDVGLRTKARAEAIRRDTDAASKLLGGKMSESAANHGFLREAAKLPGVAGERARQVMAEQQAKAGGGAAAYDKARGKAAATRARSIDSFDPWKAPIPSEDKYGGGRTAEQYLADMLEGKGILDPDGYTEDRRDKQGVDEFMDLFQPAGEQGRDTPPDWAFEQGAVPPDYNTDPSAGYGPGGYDPLPGPGAGPGPGPGPAPMPDFEPGTMGNSWQNYTGERTAQDEAYGGQLNALQGQNNQLMAQQQQAQELRGQQPPPAGPPKDPFAWANNGQGLPTVQVAGRPAEGENPYTWDFASGVTPGMTNRQAFGALEGRLSDSARGMLSEGFAGSDGDMVQFASGQHMDPNYYTSARAADTSGQYQGALDEMIGAMYNRRDLTTPPGGGPTASPGYALPISMQGGG